MKRLLFWTLAALVAAGPTAADAPAALTPEQVVAARQSSFALSAAAFGSLKAGVDQGAEVRDFGFAARALNRWARTLPTLFPTGTNAPSSKARPEVWTDRAGFDRAAADYAAATEKLAELAQANDKIGFAAQWETTRQTCQACHDKYRVPPQRR